MSNPLYAKLAATALALLTKFGRDVTLTKVTEGAYDPATSAASVSNATSTLKGATFNFAEGQTMFGNSVIQQGDKLLMLAAGGAVPDTDDSVTIGGVIWKIVSVQEVNPAGVPVIYEAQIHR